MFNKKATFEALVANFAFKYSIICVQILMGPQCSWNLKCLSTYLTLVWPTWHVTEPVLVHGPLYTCFKATQRTRVYLLSWNTVALRYLTLPAFFHLFVSTVLLGGGVGFFRWQVFKCFVFCFLWNLALRSTISFDNSVICCLMCL